MKPILFALLIFLISCKKNNPVNQPELGQIDLEINGNKKAVVEFEKGLLLLHSFEYKAAREAFQKSQELDSTIALSYWGEAMTHNHSLWQEQDCEEAIIVINKLGQTEKERDNKFKTSLERDLFNSLTKLFGTDCSQTKYERDIAYNEYMEKLVSRYPSNNEVKAFYAISLLGASRNGRDQELNDKCAQIAQGIIKENPKHPGALHYLIHAYDDPYHAELAKDAADNYSKVAPDATHALHMPSHIYVALGLWDDVINSNIASWNSSVKFKKEPSLHALNWLQYGFLQKGELDNAQHMLQKVIDEIDEEAPKVKRAYYISMVGAQMVESNDWPNLDLIEDLIYDDLSLVKRTQYHFLKGMRAYHNKDLKSLSECIEYISSEKYKATLNLGNKNFSMCSAGGFSNKPADQLDIDMATIIENQLKARLLLSQNNFGEAINILKESSDSDIELSYAYGPPTILKPVHEDLAEILLQSGDLDGALKYYERSLKKNPLRLLSLKGKKDALEKANQNELKIKVLAQINECLEKKQRELIL